MLSSVPKGARAIRMDIAIMRTFIRSREFLSTNKELAHKPIELEKRLGSQVEAIRIVAHALRRLMATPLKPEPAIGFPP